MSIALPGAREAGFTLMPVILAMSLIAAIAFLLNRDNGLNARMVASQSDLDRARYAAEAGLQAVNFVIQGRGCAGTYPTSSTPVTDGNFGGAAYSAHSTTSGGSPLSLVSTGTYNGASVTLTRANVHVYQPPRTTVVQPGPASGHDTYVNNSAQDRNFGGDVRLRLQSGSFQPLLKFDLSTFPAGTRVIPWYDSANAKLQPGALLSLYQYDISSSFTGSPKLNMQLITRSWLAGTKSGGASPDGATWRTYDGTNEWPAAGKGYAAAPVASAPYIHAIRWMDWDLTNAVAGWMSGVYPNYGVWLVEAEGIIGNTSYASSNTTSNETLNAAWRPKLSLNHLRPCGSGTSQTVERPAQADARILSGSNNNFGGATPLIVHAGSPQSRALVSFDLSDIPPGKLVKGATLRLFAASSSTANPKTVDAYALIEPWVEGSQAGSGSTDGVTWTTRDGAVNWATAGGTAPGPLIATAALPADFKGGWVTWELASLVQGWVDGVIPNHGVLLRSAVADPLNFQNREIGGANVPKLVVVYE